MRNYFSVVLRLSVYVKMHLIKLCNSCCLMNNAIVSTCNSYCRLIILQTKICLNSEMPRCQIAVYSFMIMIPNILFTHCVGVCNMIPLRLHCALEGHITPADVFPRTEIPVSALQRVL
jgi:hypothetical protein